MTVRRFGRILPLQMDVLNLGGEVLSWSGTVPPTDRDRLYRMKDAYRMLKLRTGRDFGYDLAAWHHFLINNRELSKDYTYRSKAVKQRINELIDDPERLRLVRLLEEDPDATDSLLGVETSGDNKSGAPATSSRRAL